MTRRAFSGGRSVVLAGCAVLLAWLVVTRSLAAYLADAAPQQALWLNPNQPQALINLADRSFNAPLASSETAAAPAQPAAPQDADATVAAADQSAPRRGETTAIASTNAPGGSTDFQNIAAAFSVVDRSRSVDLSALRAEAMASVRNQPLNPRAIRLLGQLADVSADPGSGFKLMSAAAHLSLHESIAVYWLVVKSASAGDYTTAVAYADALLRSNPELANAVVPILARLAADKVSFEPVKAVLDADPPWRDLFLKLLPRSSAEAHTPLYVLLALKNSPTPPKQEDVVPYVQLLAGRGFYDLAYYTWLQFLPLDQLRNAGLLFNGNFNHPPSGMPFDWAIPQGSDVAIDIVPRPDKAGEHALMVDFLYGHVLYQSVRELVKLAPGNYRFSGQYSGKLIGPRGLKWRVVCADDAHTRVGEGPMVIGATSGWKNLSFDFTIPVIDCRAQYVQLDLDARLTSEQLVSGSMLFADLGIAHVSAAANPSDTNSAPAINPPAPAPAAATK